MKKPELQDFGITPEEYARHQQLSRKSSTDSSQYAGAGCFLTLFVVAPIVGIIVFFVTSDWDRAFSWAIWSVIIGGIPGMLIGYFFYGVSEALKRHQKSRILQSPLGVQIRQYEEAIAAYEDAVKEAERKRLEIQREAEYARQAAERARQAAERAERKKRIDHWQAVRGIQFERELAALYRHLGYDVQSTPKSGDQGIDLILRKGGSTTIVQCKG